MESSAIVKPIRFRDSWFVKAGIGIIALSFGPFGSLLAVALVLRRDLAVGPTGLVLLLGTLMGTFSIALGMVGVLVRRAAKR